MDNIAFSSLGLPLKASQIVCLDHQASSLYGEVIQLIPHRQRCWFRPLCLVISSDTESLLEPDFPGQLEYVHSQATEMGILINVQAGSDLLWPDSLFRPALDTEIIYLLPQLKDTSHHSGNRTSQQKCLNQFIHLVWQAHQDKF
jgi:hypothetical protein